MQKLDQFSCGLFTIAYVVDIAFNIDVQKSNYIVNEMRQHLNFIKNEIYNLFLKNTINIYKTLNSNTMANHD
jgi:hypothetical protein